MTTDTAGADQAPRGPSAGERPPRGWRREPPVYRPFALLALAAALGAGMPLGIWMLAWLYLGTAAVPVEWILFHAHAQIFGFFGTLIIGVAQHVVPRFAGRAVTSDAVVPWLLGLQGGGMALRLLGTAAALPPAILAASVAEAAVFLLFARWVWRALDGGRLTVLRRQLVASTGWLAAACILEAGLRANALWAGLPLPPAAGLRVVHLMGLCGGLLGWVLGVILRAGPMFLPRWRAPMRLARGLPVALALGVGVAAWGEAGAREAATGAALARLGELIVLGSAAAVVIVGGALAAARDALPMASRSGDESRIFRVAMLSGAAALMGAAAALPAAWAGRDVRLVADAVRHLLTVGVLTSMVVAMALRLIPALEGRALPWPGLRRVALWSLSGGVALRTAELLVPAGWTALAPWIPLSGVLVWIAVACVGASLLGAIATRVPAPVPVL